MGKEGSKLIKSLKEFKDIICQKYDIKEVILFGSHVSGTADEDSDVDLIVVGDEFRDKSPLKRPFELYLEWTMDFSKIEKKIDSVRMDTENFQSVTEAVLSSREEED